jgi:glycosyltransferase involved in cell wall biosynthesis
LHIARCLRDILSGGIEVILIDHESKIRTVEIARRYLGDGLLSIERLA